VIEAQKNAIRKQLRTLRNNLTTSEVENNSHHIQKNLETHPTFLKATHILLYFSHQKEVSTLELIKKWHTKKKIYLPVLKDDNLFEVGEYEREKLTINHYGIAEPTHIEKNPTLNLIIVPGLGFDKSGNRIGMGKGYYDRFLLQKKGIERIALCHDIQILDQIPKGPYDENVDEIITEKRVIRCKKK